MTVDTNVGAKKKDDVTFEVKEEIFKLTPRENGKQIRLDLASWNGGEDHYELRIWATLKGEFKATKGLGLSGAELKELRDKLNELDFEG